MKILLLTNIFCFNLQYARLASTNMPQVMNIVNHVQPIVKHRITGFRNVVATLDTTEQQKIQRACHAHVSKICIALATSIFWVLTSKIRHKPGN